MDLTLLAALERKLTEARQFSDVMNYFFDHFGESPEFMALGEPTRDPFLESVLGEVAAQLFKGPGLLAMELRLVRLAEHGFIHGSVMMGGKQGTVLYFERSHAGLLALLWSVDPPETKYARFRGQALPRTTEPSLN